MNHLPNELVVNELLPLLSCDDLVSFKRGCKSTYLLATGTRLLGIWRKRIEQYLQRIFQDDLPALYDFLQQTRSAISGSALVQAIRQEYYDKSDIDFICPKGTTRQVLEDFCSKLGQKLELTYEGTGSNWEKSTEEDKVIENVYECKYLGLPTFYVDAAENWQQRPLSLPIKVKEEVEITSQTSLTDDATEEWQRPPTIEAKEEEKTAPLDSWGDDATEEWLQRPPRPPPVRMDNRRDGPSELRSRDKKLNFIVANDTPSEHIKTYDLTIVQNIYTRSLERGFLHVTDTNAILNKWLIVACPTGKYIERIDRYQMRGFKIISPTIKEDIKILNLLLPLQRPYRGQIKSSVTDDLGAIMAQRDDLHPCYAGFDCYLKNFVRKYYHAHVVPGAPRLDHLRKLYKYCSELIIELLDHQFKLST